MAQQAAFEARKPLIVWGFYYLRKEKVLKISMLQNVGVKVSKCHGVKVHHQICRFELLKYIYILNIIYRRIFAPDI